MEANLIWATIVRWRAETGGVCSIYLSVRPPPAAHARGHLPLKGEDQGPCLLRRKCVQAVAPEGEGSSCPPIASNFITR